MSAPSAIEAARRIAAKHQYSSTPQFFEDVETVARAYLRAVEALEKIAGYKPMPTASMWNVTPADVARAALRDGAEPDKA